MNQQLNQRPEPLAFRVLISKTKELNIILSNRRIENERTYSHFVTLEQAEEFAANLEAALSSKYYTRLDRCFLCGQPFTRTEEVCVLTHDDCLRIIHEIREKAEMVRSAEIGTCFCCEKTVYVDEDRFIVDTVEKR